MLSNTPKQIKLYCETKFFFAFCACWLVHTYAQTQANYSTNYTVSDGLPSATIYCAVQDLEGYMWFSTDAGVSRFDGKSFRNFGIDDGLCDNEILSMGVDSRGRIWFLSLSGCLCCFDHGRILNGNNSPGLNIPLSGRRVRYNFFEDKTHRIWIGGNSHEVISIDPKLKASSIKVVSGSAHIVFEHNEKIYVTDKPNSSFRLATDLFVVDPENFELQHVGDTLNFDCTMIFFGPGGRKYVPTMEGIGILENLEVSTIIPMDSMSGLNDVRRVFVDKNENVFALDQTLRFQSFEKRGKQYRRKPKADIIGVDVSFVYVDNDLNRWYCTTENGVYMFSPLEQSNFSLYRFSQNERPTRIEADHFGNVAVGTSEGFVYVFQNEELISVFGTSSNTNMEPIKDIEFDKDNNLWTLTNQHIQRNSFREGVFDKTPDKLLGKGRGSSLKSMCFDENESIFVGTFNGVAYVNGDDDSYGLNRIINEIDNRIYELCMSNDGTLWFESGNQLNSWKDSVLTKYPSLTSEFSTRITSIELIPDGALAISTEGGGVKFFKDGEIIGKIDVESGLPTNECGKLFISGNTHFLTTKKGLVIYEYNSAKPQVTDIIDHTDGLMSDKVYDVFYNGELVYLATYEGLLFYRLHEEKHAFLPPLVHWISFQAGNIEFDFSREIEFPFEQSLVRIGYIGIDFASNNEIQFQYSLNENPWILTTANALEFFSLNPGLYNIRVRAKKQNSDWSEPISLSFSIHPPYYATTWFRFLLGCTILLVGFWLFRIFEKRKYERKMSVIMREQAVMSERNRISSDMHDDLGSELSNIVILSRVAQEQLGLSQEQKAPISKIDRAATDTIGKMNEIIWALNPANDTLENLASYIQKYTNNFLEFHELNGRAFLSVDIPVMTLSAQLRRNVFLIVKEALQNIHKHSGASVVELKMNFEPDRFIVQISDNGKGFSEQKIAVEGNGLRNMRKRTSDIGGTIRIETRPEGGSEITLSVPRQMDL